MESFVRSTKSLFITGASGFIGRHLLHRLNPEDYRNVYCVSRTEGSGKWYLSRYKNVKVLKGDILHPSSYEACLSDSDIVVHLAAVTGKEKPEEYFNVNARGTEVLVRQCEKCRIKTFLYVSSIAVKYPDLSGYYYAQAKKQGEGAVRSSGLDYAIVRPTIVIGRQGSSWKSLSRLAKGPLSIVPGHGRTKIQPVYIDDLVDCILSIVNENLFSNDIFEIGGPEVISFRDFLRQIHIKYHGLEGISVHIPLGPLTYLMKGLEKVAYSVLPINIGQLSAFGNDSTIRRNELFFRHQKHMRNVDQMLDIVISSEKKEMKNDTLANECRTFCKYLVNAPSNDYVIKKYMNAHRVGGIDQYWDSFSLEPMLMYLARSNAVGTRLVDTYTRIFLRRSVVRKKLVLLLAILECSSAHYSLFDRVDFPNPSEFAIKLAYRSFSFLITMLLALLCLSPIRLIFYLASKLRESDL